MQKNILTRLFLFVTGDFWLQVGSGRFPKWSWVWPIPSPSARTTSQVLETSSTQELWIKQKLTPFREIWFSNSFYKQILLTRHYVRTFNFYFWIAFHVCLRWNLCVRICKGDYEYSMVLIKLCYLWVLLLPISFMSVILLSKIRLNILSYGDYRISINIRPDQILSRSSLMCSLFLVVFIWVWVGLVLLVIDILQGHYAEQCKLQVSFHWSILYLI